MEWTYSTLGPGDCIYIPSGKYALFSLNCVFLSVSLNQHQRFYSTLSSQTQNSDQSPASCCIIKMMYDSQCLKT